MNKKLDKIDFTATIALWLAIFACIIGLVAVANPHKEFQTREIERGLKIGANQKSFAQRDLVGKKNWDLGTFNYSCTSGVKVDDWLDCESEWELGNCTPGVIFWGKGACVIKYKISRNFLVWG